MSMGSLIATTPVVGHCMKPIQKMTVERMPVQPKVNVQCVMAATKIIGPYLLRNTMNAEHYLQILDIYVWPAVSG